MANSYIPYDFTSGTYRAKIVGNYQSVDSVTYSSPSSYYQFTVTKTVAPKPIAVSYIRATNTMTANASQGTDTYSSTKNTSISGFKYSASVASSSSSSFTLTNGQTGTQFLITFDSVSISYATSYTRLYTRTGSEKTPYISSSSSSSIQTGVLSTFNLYNFYTEGSITNLTYYDSYDSRYTYSWSKGDGDGYYIDCDLETWYGSLARTSLNDYLTWCRTRSSLAYIFTSEKPVPQKPVINNVTVDDNNEMTIEWTSDSSPDEVHIYNVATGEEQWYSRSETSPLQRLCPLGEGSYYVIVISGNGIESDPSYFTVGSSPK